MTDKLLTLGKAIFNQEGPLFSYSEDTTFTADEIVDGFIKGLANGESIERGSQFVVRALEGNVTPSTLLEFLLLLEEEKRFIRLAFLSKSRLSSYRRRNAKTYDNKRVLIEILTIVTTTMLNTLNLYVDSTLEENNWTPADSQALVSA